MLLNLLLQINLNFSINIILINCELILKMENYKGMNYVTNEEQHYYEGGAHFKYKELYCKLEKLAQYFIKSRREIDYYLEYKEKRNAFHSRNFINIIKTQSQNQIDNVNIYYQQTHNNRNNIDNQWRSNHPRTKSEETNSIKQILLPFNLNLKQDKINSLKEKHDNSINSSQFIRNQHHNHILYNNNSSSYSSGYLFKQKNNEQKPTCSLLKVPKTNMPLNYCYNHNEQSKTDLINNFSIMRTNINHVHIDDIAKDISLRLINSKNNVENKTNNTQSNVLIEHSRNYEKNHFNKKVKQSPTSLNKVTNNYLLANRNNTKDISNCYNFNYSKQINLSQGKVYTVCSDITSHSNNKKIDIIPYKEDKPWKKLEHNSLRHIDTYRYTKPIKNHIIARHKPLCPKEKTITTIDYPYSKKIPIQSVRYKNSNIILN